MPRNPSSRVQKAHPLQSDRKKGSRIFGVGSYFDVPRRPLSKDTRGFQRGRKTGIITGLRGTPCTSRIRAINPHTRVGERAIPPPVVAHLVLI